MSARPLARDAATQAPTRRAGGRRAHAGPIPRSHPHSIVLHSVCPLEEGSHHAPTPRHRHCHRPGAARRLYCSSPDAPATRRTLRHAGCVSRPPHGRRARGRPSRTRVLEPRHRPHRPRSAHARGDAGSADALHGARRHEHCDRRRLDRVRQPAPWRHGGPRTRPRGTEPRVRHHRRGARCLFRTAVRRRWLPLHGGTRDRPAHLRPRRSVRAGARRHARDRIRRRTLGRRRGRSRLCRGRCGRPEDRRTSAT